MGSKKRGKPVTHPKIVRKDTGEVFDTFTEAGDSVGGSRFGVMKCCYKIQHKHKGREFEFIKEEK